MKRRSSLRTTLAPIPSTPIASLPVGLHPLRKYPESAHRSRINFEKSDLAGQSDRLFRRLRNLHAAGGIEYRFDDIVVARAAADIALELAPDGGLIELAAMAV